MADNVIRPQEIPEDRGLSLRPQTLDGFVGQRQLRENLRIFIHAARERRSAMDHALFHGPPGLGKTTLAHIVAGELDVDIRVTSGPALVRAGDLAAILTNLEPRSVLFIDEIHRLNPSVEETLYPALEDYELDLVIGQGPAARIVRIGLQPFTLIGATTRLGLITTPLRERFGIQQRLEFYAPEQLAEIITRAATRLEVDVEPAGAREIAGRSRGVPRIAIRMLRRISDFAVVAGVSAINRELASHALRQLEVDDAGLDSADRRYLRCLAENYAGGPAGVETLSAALSETRDAIEDVIEPFLLQQGLVLRTPRGRVLSARAWSHLGLDAPSGSGLPLFEEVEESDDAGWQDGMEGGTG